MYNYKFFDLSDLVDSINNVRGYGYVYNYCLCFNLDRNILTFEQGFGESCIINHDDYVGFLPFFISDNVFYYDGDDFPIYNKKDIFKCLCFYIDSELDKFSHLEIDNYIMLQNNKIILEQISKCEFLKPSEKYDIVSDLGYSLEIIGTGHGASQHAHFVKILNDFTSKKYLNNPG